VFVAILFRRVVVLAGLCLSFPLTLSFVIFQKLSMLLVDLFCSRGGVDGGFFQELYSLFLFLQLRFLLGRFVLLAGEGGDICLFAELEGTIVLEGSLYFLIHIKNID
jgi:hypothetical protein